MTGLGEGSTSDLAAPVRCPIIISRRAELAALDAALASARQGRGGVVLLVGEPGIGKSRLSREADVRARATAMRSLRGRATPGVAPLPFRPLAEALAPAVRDGGVASDPGLAEYRSPLDVLLGGGEARGAATNRLLLFEAATRLLHIIAGDEGLLVTLEDLHWSDADTLEFVDYVSDNLREARVLLLCTLRDDPTRSMGWAEALAARRSATLIRLARLSSDEVAEMARLSLDVDSVAQDLIDMLRDRAEGVPFFVEEMLTAYVASGRDVTAAESLPHTFRELVRGRLDLLDEQTRQVVSAAAVIGRRFEWSLLEAVTGLDRPELLEGMRRAVRAQIVVVEAGRFEMPFGFRHALVREAVLAEMLPPERSELSSTAAAVIEDRFPGLPGDWCERAAELREAAGDRASAARHLQEAARRALVRGALASAGMMLERARALVSGDRWHLIGIDRQLVEVLSLAGNVERLRDIGDAAVAFVKEKRALMPFITLGLGDLHLRLARGMMTAGDEAAAVDHLEHARRLARDTREAGQHSVLGDQTHLTAGVTVFDAQRALAAGDLDVALAAAREAAEQAEALRLPDVRAEALSVEGRAAFGAGDAALALTTLVRARDEAAPVSRIGALLDLGEVESSLGGSLETLESARTLAASVGAVSSEARADLLIGAALVDRFELDAARTVLARCIDTCRRYRLALLSPALAVEAQRLALIGSDRDAQAVMAEAGTPPSARAVSALLREERDEAEDALAGVRRDSIEADLAALLAAVRGDQARMQGTSAHAVGVGLRSFAGLVGCDRGEVPARFAEADGLLERFPWWRHLARRLVAEAAIDDAWGEPAAWVRESLAFFDASGLERMASACRSLLRRAGVAVPRKGRGDAKVPAELSARGVTSREMDVLRLVGEGLGNREIARRLFLSPRTVETHVSSLMRKLELPDRAALASAVTTPTP